MASDQPDLTLPERIPEMEQYHDKPMELLPFALYTLCDIPDEKLESYRLICTTDTFSDLLRFSCMAQKELGRVFCWSD